MSAKRRPAPWWRRPGNSNHGPRERSVEFAMNIYTEPAAPATETATDSTAPRAQSWRDTLSIHPAAELFPRMSEAELAALGKDIRKHGLTSSIAVWSDGKSPEQLLDGRSRLDAIEIEIGPAIVGPPSVMAGKDFLAVNKVIVLDRSVDPYAFVISANIHRRHLTGEQKHELIAKLIETDPTKSNRQIAKTVKVDHKTVASVRAEKEGRGESPHVETRTDSKGRKQPARKTTTKPPPVSAEVLQQREAGRIRVGWAATRSATTSAPRARANANGCVHATKNCKPSLRILSSTTSRSAARSGN